MPKQGPGTKFVLNALRHAAEKPEQGSMDRQGPGTKFVLKSLKDAAEKPEQGSRERQGPGTKLVLKGLKRALPHIAEPQERHSREHRRRSHIDGGESLCIPWLPPLSVFS